MSGIPEGRVQVMGELPGRLVGFRNPGKPGTPIRASGVYKKLDAVVERDGVETRVSGTVMVGISKSVFIPGVNLVDLEINDKWKHRDLKPSNILSDDIRNRLPILIDLPDIHGSIFFSDRFEIVSRPGYREEGDIWRHRDLRPSNILDVFSEKPADPFNLFPGLTCKDEIQVDFLSYFSDIIDPIPLAMKFFRFIAEPAK